MQTNRRSSLSPTALQTQTQTQPQSHELPAPLQNSANFGSEANVATAAARAADTSNGPASLNIQASHTEGRMSQMSEPTSSDSETLDTLRIIKSSDQMRTQLSRYLVTQDISSDPNSDAGSKGNKSDDSERLDVAHELPLQSLSLTAGLLHWNPQFLDAPSSSVNKESSNPGGATTTRGADTELLHHCAYPLRKRLERNLHPYTKLVWTNPDELRSATNVRRDTSVLSDVFSNTLAQADAGLAQEDSEDDDYVPGSPELRNSADADSQFPDLDIAHDPFGSSNHRRGATYGHLLHRQRHTQHLHPYKRRRHNARHTITRRQRRQTRKKQDGIDDLPNVSSLLGARDNSHSTNSSASDSLGIGSRRPRRLPSSDLNRPPSPLDEPEDFFDKDQMDIQQNSASQPHMYTSVALRHLSEQQPRLTLSQGVQIQPAISSGQNLVQTSSDSSSDSPAGHLPTVRARKLRDLSRKQIRGVLPFSFMRDFNQDRQREIQEEIGRWRRSNPKAVGRRRVLSSSPDGSGSEPTSYPRNRGHSLRANDGLTPAGSVETGADLVAELFSDASSHLPVNSADEGHSQPSDVLLHGTESASTSKRIQFSFNFVDMYEWQYPPLAPPGTVEPAPAFLRVAARESRRNGVRAKAAPDDPFKKAISIAARRQSESDDGELAQSILASWKLGMIDIRRVYFCDDLEDSDGFEDHQEVEEYGWSDHDDLAAGFETTGIDPIYISDDEAIEDNSISGIRHKGKYQQRNGHRKATARSRYSSRNEKGALPELFERRPATGPRDRRFSTSAAATRGLDSVMGEFAAVSSGDEAGSSSRYTLPPKLASRLPVDTASDQARQQSFIHQFRRQPKSRSSAPSQYRGKATHTSQRHARSAGSTSRSRATYGRRSGLSNRSYASKAPASAARNEFLFDEEHRPGVNSKAQGGVLKNRQQVLLPGRPAQPSQAPAIRSFRSMDRAVGAQHSRLDDVVARISKQRSSLSPLPQNTSYRGCTVASIKGKHVQRKQAPTRVIQPNYPIRNSALAIPADEHSTHLLNKGRDGNASDSQPKEQLPFGGSLDALCNLPSGTRFGNGTWISQGGIVRIQRMMHNSFGLVTRQTNKKTEGSGKSRTEPTSAATYKFNDALYIDSTATAAEFAQAYSTLIALWYESLESAGTLLQTPADAVVASVMQWIDFAQKYLHATIGSNRNLSLVAQKVADCIHGGLSTLDRLADSERRNIPLAAAICFSFIIALAHLAVVFLGQNGAIGSLGPTAVGEDDELDPRWTRERFKSEIDNCMLVLVRFLSFETPMPHTTRLCPTKEIWIALIHMFPGADLSIQQHESTVTAQRAQAGASSPEARLISSLVPATGVWAAVSRVCSLYAKTERQLAACLWSAFFYLLPLTQMNSHGVAGPHVQPIYHKPLASILEAAVEKQLLGADRQCQTQQLNKQPVNELAIRQAYFRVHSAVVRQGIAVSINSSLYVQLYRYLEGRKFRSLDIEPSPSLPRFFTRYCGGISRGSSPSDTCAILWLKSLDSSMDEWIAHLESCAQGSKDHRRLLRDIRTMVSKMLPTRLLTFDGSTEQAHLSTLANYYSVFLFFLHAVPSDVVRATRLYTQFQALLKFRESVSLIARRVYFEAWSAAVIILLLNLCKLLQSRGDVDRIFRNLVADDTQLATATATAAAAAAATADSQGVPANISDYIKAIKMATDGWSESLDIIMSECVQGERVHKATNDLRWELVDAALMYLNRVLASTAFAHHAPSVLLLVYLILKSPQTMRLAVYDGHIPTSAHLSIWKRILFVLRARQLAISGTLSTTSGTQAPPDIAADFTTPDKQPTACNRDGVDGADGADQAAGPEHRHDQANSAGDDSQFDLGMFDSMDLLVAAEEAEEQERLASFAPIDAKILELFHEQYIPNMRVQLVSKFTSISGSSKGWGHKRRFSELEANIDALVYIVSACVDAGLRTWSSFLDEYGRDSLHLIPDKFGCRLVLLLFSISMVNLMRSKGQSVQSMEHEIKAIWFSSACDLRLTPYVHLLSAQLRWLDEHCAETTSLPGTAVFVGIPVDRRLLDSNGLLRDDPVLEEKSHGLDHGDRASLAISFIDFMLQAIQRSIRAEAAASQLGHARSSELKQLLSSWVSRLVDAQKEIQAESNRSVHGLADIRALVDAMAKRVSLMIRDNCAELSLPSNLALHT